MYNHPCTGTGSYFVENPAIYRPHTWSLRQRDWTQTGEELSIQEALDLLGANEAARKIFPLAATLVHIGYTLPCFLHVDNRQRQHTLVLLEFSLMRNRTSKTKSWCRTPPLREKLLRIKKSRRKLKDQGMCTMCA